jgi:endo-1,3-1,4-beta-glycanase ExoK
MVVGAVLLIVPSAATAQPPPGVGQQTWSEDFAGNGLDRERWGYRATGPRSDGILTPSAVSVGDGLLTIKTYTDAEGKHRSGMISTEPGDSRAGFEQTYGYFEARVKFNDEPGQWSAFWLQTPTNGDPPGKPAAAGVEMDIVEHRARCVSPPPPLDPQICRSSSGITNRIRQALVWDGYDADSKSAVRLSDPLPQLGNGSWHTWGLRWTPTALTFYYDDVPIWSKPAPISRRGQFIILSSEVGEFFAGNIPRDGYGSFSDSTTTMQVDYVRAWALD